jgi:hypothetical protein
VATIALIPLGGGRRAVGSALSQGRRGLLAPLPASKKYVNNAVNVVHETRESHKK